MDLDRDGNDDLLTGSWPGRVYWFARRDDGTFARMCSLLLEDGEELDVGQSSTPCATDWDGDGDLDLIVGDRSGAIHFFARTQDESGKPTFEAGRRVSASGSVIDVGSDAGPSVADWDGDGQPDLIVGDGMGVVRWYRHVSKPESADGTVLAAPLPLIGEPTDSENPAITPHRGSRAKICVTDWNEDGLLDLLVGEFGVQPPSPEAQLAGDEFQRLMQQHGELGKKIADAETAPKAASHEARTAHRRERDALCAEWVQLDQKISLSVGGWSGRVWLFLQKPSADSLPGR